MAANGRKALAVLAAAAITFCIAPVLAFADTGAGAADLAPTGFATATDTDTGDGLVVSAQSTNTSASGAIDRLKTQRYFKPGGTCPEGLNEGWLRYGDSPTNCEAECYAFACGVCEELFGRHPSGIMDTGYTCKYPNGLACVGSYENPSLSTVTNLMMKAYPGDYLQFCSGGGWGTAQHSAVVEAVDANGVRIYQHGDLSHVSSTYYSWTEFYYSYLGMDKKNFRGYAGVSLYHAENYEEVFGAGETLQRPDPSDDPGADPSDDPDDDPFDNPESDNELDRYKGTASSSKFTDLAADAWYMSKSGGAFPGSSTLYLDYTLGKGLMSGYAKTTNFGPDDGLTRSMAATIIYRLATGKTADNTDNDNVSSPFGDVEPGQWYAAAVTWCARKGVVTGYDDSAEFGPDDPVTREQLTAMIARYCENVKNLAHAEADITGFVDYDLISGWARPHAAFCVASDIVSGMGDTGAFAPQDGATRCQMAKIIAVTARLTA